MPTLNWLDRDKTLRSTLKVPARILVEDTRFSYGDKGSGNMLIEGR